MNAKKGWILVVVAGAALSAIGAASGADTFKLPPLPSMSASAPAASASASATAKAASLPAQPHGAAAAAPAAGASSALPKTPLGPGPASGDKAAASRPVPAAKAEFSRPRNESAAALYKQLDELRSQNAVLTEALKNAKLKSDIANAGKPAPAAAAQPSATPLAPPGGFSPGGQFGAPSMPAFAASPQVQMVSGSDIHNLSALIALPGGGRVVARVGTSIPGLGVVKSISPNEVVVAPKGGESVVVPFSGEAGSGSR